MDNYTKGLDSTPSHVTTVLAGNQNDVEVSSSLNLGAIVGIAVGLIVLAGSLVGLVFFIKRRRRQVVGPLSRPGKNDMELNPTRTTWHEDEAESNRSSDISSVVDYNADVEDEGLEMQPSTLFPGAHTYMYDTDSIDEVLNPQSALTSEANGDGIDKSTRERKKVGTSSNKQNKADEKTTVIYDKQAKSFKIRGEDRHEPGGSTETNLKKQKRNDQIEIENETSNVDSPDGNGQEPRKVYTKTIQNGYELAKVIPNEDSEKGKSNTVKIGSSLGNSDGDEGLNNIRQNDSYVNVSIEKDDMYVNHATLIRESTVNQDITSNKASDNTVVDHVVKPPRKAPSEVSLEDKTIERKSFKTPMPQPRQSKRISSNTNVQSDSKADQTKVDKAQDTTEIDDSVNSRTVHTVDKYVEYDPADFDPADLDYDTVDSIYDVPKNCKRVDGDDESDESDEN